MKCDELQSLWVYSRDIEENCDEKFVNFAKENGYEELVEKKEVIEAIAELKAENAELKEAQRWRKCSEELPEDGSDVLATDGEEIWLCYKTTMTDGLPWFQPNGQPHIEGVTHWMPLPSAPKEEK